MFPMDSIGFLYAHASKIIKRPTATPILGVGKCFLTYCWWFRNVKQALLEGGYPSVSRISSITCIATWKEIVFFQVSGSQNQFCESFCATPSSRRHLESWYTFEDQDENLTSGGVFLFRRNLLLQGMVLKMNAKLQECYHKWQPHLQMAQWIDATVLPLGSWKGWNAHDQQRHERWSKPWVVYLHYVYGYILWRVILPSYIIWSRMYTTIVSWATIKIPVNEAVVECSKGFCCHSHQKTRASPWFVGCPHKKIPPKTKTTEKTPERKHPKKTQHRNIRNNRLWRGCDVATLGRVTFFCFERSNKTWAMKQNLVV